MWKRGLSIYLNLWNAQHSGCALMYTKNLVCTCALAVSLPGASMGNPARGKGHEERGLTYAKVGSGLRDSPPDFPEHLPPKQSLPALLCYAFHLFF